jgi:Tfp pilus assembly protein PilW
MSMIALADFPSRPPKRLRDLQGDSGTTLIELMVALTAGLVVFGAITALLLMTIRQSGRVTSHVEANQRARTAMTKIVNELHSACFFPQVTPVREGSSGTKLVFWHQSGSAVAPTPVQSEIELTGGELVQRNAQPISGGGNEWTFPTTKAAPEPLMKAVGPMEEAGPIFTYYSYSSGEIASTPLVAPLDPERAGKTVQVNIAFKAAPEPPISEDEHSATGISDSVLLRLTPPSYEDSSDNPPCE